MPHHSKAATMRKLFMRPHTKKLYLILLWSSFLASLPLPACCGEAAAPYRLTMEEAIAKGLQANINVLVAETRLKEAEGTRERRLSGYLPRARLETPFAYQTINTQFQGLSQPNIPPVVGPFTTYDFRVRVDQTLLDLQNYHSLQASEKDQLARHHDYQDILSLLIRQVAGQYLRSESAQALAVAAESRVQYAQTLEQLARDQRNAGVATGLDVLRAQVQLANDRQSLLVAQNATKQALLVLARNIGLSPGTPLELADTLGYRPINPPLLEEALPGALQGRADYRSLLAQRESLQEQIKSSRSRFLPRVTLSGNYGTGGQHLDELNATGAVQANLVFTLYDRDREGEHKELDSRLRRVERQLADQRLGIEQDIREAILNLESAAEQVKVAQAGLELAQQTLQLAGERFKHGVADNVEVVNAQDSLARAQQNSIFALTNHVDAKIALARALGDTGNTYKTFLGIE